MNFQQSRKTGLARLAHLGEVTEAVGERMELQRDRFEALRNEESKPHVVSAFNLFQTPEDLAARAVSLVEGYSGRWLEPSAGLGRIYRAMRARTDDHITLVEIAPQCCAELYREIELDDNAQLIQEDFLQCSTERLSGKFDVIVANPPFKMWRDIKHINHMGMLLAPGGRCVSFCANGPKQQAKIKPHASQWIELDSGSFKSEGTRVNAAIAVFDN